MTDDRPTPEKTDDEVKGDAVTPPPSPETEHIRDEGEPLGGNVA